MKKTFVCISAALIAGNVFSQQKINAYEWNVKQTTVKEYSKKPNTSSEVLKGPQKSLGDTIWKEDFANGIPSGWKNSGFVYDANDNPIPNANAKWEYRGPTTNPDIKKGSRGGCMNDTITVVSPTRSNGFVIFDSNYLDDTGGKCPPVGPKGAVPAPHAGVLETGAINLTGKTSLALTFYYYARSFVSSQSVNISNDGGNTWTEIWEAGLDVNQSSYIDSRTTINISCYAANQADVRFQFVFNGTYYAWMLDDIAVVEAEPDELVMAEVFLADSNFEYTYLPLKQAIANPYVLSSVIISSGADVQNNIMLNVDIDNGTKSVFAMSSDPTALVCDTELISAPPFTPSETGTYTAGFWVTSDSVKTDTAYKSFSVTDSVYGRDYMWDVSKIDGTWTLGATCGTQEIGYPFEIFTEQVATSISAYFSKDSRPKAIVYGIIYEVNNEGNPVKIDVTPDYTLTTKDISNRWVSVPFSEPVVLTAGGVYFACIGGYAGTDTSAVVTAGKVSTGYAYINDVDGGCEEKAGWYYLPVAPVVRLNVNDYNSISETKNNINTYIHPNPANDYFNLVFSNAIKDNYTFEIRNILGKQIYQENATIKGSVEKKFDISNYSKGIYFLTIRNSESETTQKIVVK